MKDRVLSHSKFIEIQGLNHDSAQNYCKPEIVAKELKRFFKWNDYIMTKPWKFGLINSYFHFRMLVAGSAKDD